MIPHKSRQYCAILDLSYTLKVFGMELPSVNASTSKFAPPSAMEYLGTILRRIIEALAWAPPEDGDILFSKLDIKDNFWHR